MKPTLIALAMTLTIPTMWAQQPARRNGRGASLAPLHSPRTADSLHVKSIRSRAAATGRDATAPPPAPGVVEIHQEQGQVFAYFIATSTIPAGSTFSGLISVDNGTSSVGEIDFDNVQFNSDKAPGDTVFLPNISAFGDVWPFGVVTYKVNVKIGNTLTEANGNVLFGQLLGNGDLANFAPLIANTSQNIGSNRDVILAIQGVFTGDAPLVVLDSFATAPDGSLVGTFVVPSSAIVGSSASEIDIDLSRVPGLDLTSLIEYELTVSQAGFGDTYLFRYVPPPANTFNPAPQ